MAFTVQDPDFELSPHTGMTRDHWKQAGLFLLDGVFRHVDDPEAPIALPKQPGKSYPQPDDPAWKYRSAEFEGLSRTLMIAGPIIEEDPDVEVRGMNLRDYYANLILRATDPNHEQFVGRITDMQEDYGQPLFQHTAEGAALALGLTYAKSAIWDRYSPSEKDQIAELLSDYVHSRTNSHNWRFFNVMMGSFLRAQGYDVDETILLDHLQNLMAFYAGDGWYRDMGQFDYYSCWAFQFYGPIWANWFGYDWLPEVAEILQRRHGELMKTYPAMFSREGHSFMWGRSIIYRCAASAPMPAAFLLKHTPVEPGWARRVATGNLLQFITRDDTFIDGVPSLGFFRTFDPLVQAYSCAVSPFWLAKVFLALHLPADSAFWTATESEGDWEELGEKDCKTTVLDGPGLAYTIHGKTGACELRPGKVGGGKSNPNYSRVQYSTAFGWETDSDEGHTAGTYSALQIGYDLPFMANKTLRYVGEKDGVLYRQTDLPGWMARIDLADIPVAGGLLRVDRVSMPYCHELHLGHYGVPHVEGRKPDVDPIEAHGAPGVRVSGDLRQTILVAISGWDGIDVAEHHGLNSEAEDSTVAYCHRRLEKDYGGMFLAVTVMLHGAAQERFTHEEMNPVAEVELIPWTASGQPCGAKVTLRDGRELTVDFEEMMGRIST